MAGRMSPSRKRATTRPSEPAERSARSRANYFPRKTTPSIFAKLCVKQQCYRARLTPKPGRIKQRKIAYRWPMDPDEFEKAKEWVREYEAASLGFATCRHVKTFGKEHPTFGIVALHDEETKARSRLPLA